MLEAVAHGDVTTRRSFIAKGGVVAAGVAAVAVPLVESEASASSSRLSRDRRRTFGALVEAVGSFPGTRVDSGEGSAAGARLAQEYRRAGETERHHIDLVLDAIAATTGARAFASVSVERRLVALRESLRNGATRACVAPASHRVREAVALAVAAFDPAGFRWDPSLADVWIRAQRLHVATARPRCVSASDA